MKRPSLLGLSSLITVVLLMTAPGASANWLVPSTGTGMSKALNMPVGGTTSVSSNGRNVTVSWPQRSLQNGANIQDYQVKRYDASGVASTPLSSCSGVVSALTCTENAVPPGTWKYSVTPRKGNWTGTEGVQSSNVVIDAPKLSFSSSTSLTSMPASLNGEITGFITGQNVTFRLDNATTGPVLSGTVDESPIPNDGQSGIDVTIPVGTSNGTHTVFAVGSQGDIAQASISVNLPPFTPTSLVYDNNGTSGRIEKGESLQVTYSSAFDVTTVCSSWSGNGSNQILQGEDSVKVHINNNAASGNDSLTVSVTGACGDDFHFGSINLGHSGFVTADTTFSGSSTSERSLVYWAPGTRQLTVMLGAKSSGPNPGRINQSVTSVYTPDPMIRSTSGAGITGTANRPGVAF